MWMKSFRTRDLYTPSSN